VTKPNGHDAGNGGYRRGDTNGHSPFFSPPLKRRETFFLLREKLQDFCEKPFHFWLSLAYRSLRETT